MVWLENLISDEEETLRPEEDERMKLAFFYL